jgi:hypothetical protein
VSIDLRDLRARVSHDALYGSQIEPGGQGMGPEGVPQKVGINPLCNSAPQRGPGDRLPNIIPGLSRLRIEP